jgi:glucosylceramidase
MNRKIFFYILTLAAGISGTGYSQTIQPVSVESWVTNPDRSALFRKQSDNIVFSNITGSRGSTIIIDEASRFQEIDGFGFALTGGSAELLMKMTPSARSAVLKELFASDDNNIGVSYIRLTIGASDLNSFVFSYDDLKEGETDFELNKFTLSMDLNDVIPVMKEILSINADIKILGSPWSAPGLDENQWQYPWWCIEKRVFRCLCKVLCKIHPGNERP